MEITKRKAEVIRLVVKGLSNREVAQALGCSEKNIKDHLTGIYAIVGVKSRGELTSKFVSEGLNAGEFAMLKSVFEEGA